MSQNSNPLSQFFRRPSIYIRLPSAGRYWQPGSVDMPHNGELPVFPMTAIDEITYRTPDALFNGQAVVDVIQSCIPAIRNAWHMPNIDTNALLVAIRIASYGHDLEMTTVCPNCSNQDDFSVDLRNALDQLEQPNYDEALVIGDLEIACRPMSFEQQNNNNIDQFSGQKMLSNIPESGLSETEKLEKMTELLKNITALTIRAIAASISSIRTPQALVTEPEFILEYLQNCDSAVYNTIRDHVVALRTASDFKPVHVTCTNCQTEFDTPLNLDQSNFFARAS